MIKTSISSVFASQNAHALAESFISCSAAQILLESAETSKPLWIRSTPSMGPSTGFVTKDGVVQGTQIFLPERVLAPNDENKENGLHLLAYEIFNAQTSKYSDLLKQVEKGEVGMDLFAKMVEKKEIDTTNKQYELIEKCKDQWNFFIKKPIDPDAELFLAEVSCHTDVYRTQWIKNVQPLYCSKHPDDNRSCKSKVDDFCNWELLETMPEEFSDRIRSARLCEMYPTSPESAKNLPFILNKIEQNCPQILGPRTCPIEQPKNESYRLSD